MELLFLWILASVILALVWFLYELNLSLKESRHELIDLQKLFQAERDTYRLERRDLYDRLMAGTLPQYKEQADAPNEIADDVLENDEVIDIEDAREELVSGN